MKTELPDGFTAIENEAQLVALIDGFYVFVNKHGEESRKIRIKGGWFDSAGRCHSGHLRNFYIGFRHIPDTAPAQEQAASVQADTVPDGFEKKTVFGFNDVDWLILNAYDPATIDMASHIQECHTELDNRQSVIDSQEKEIAELKAAKTNLSLSRALNGWGVEMFKECTARLEAELSALKAAREWKPIESAEQLDALPAATFELTEKASGSLTVAEKYYMGNDPFWLLAGNGALLSKHVLVKYSHYRLITRAEDFTPPVEEHKIKIEAGEYSREEILEMLGESNA